MLLHTSSSDQGFYNMHFFVMFVTAVGFLFLIQIITALEKLIYESFVYCCNKNPCFCLDIQEQGASECYAVPGVC